MNRQSMHCWLLVAKREFHDLPNSLSRANIATLAMTGHFIVCLDLISRLIGSLEYVFKQVPNCVDGGTDLNVNMRLISIAEPGIVGDDPPIGYLVVEMLVNKTVENRPQWTKAAVIYILHERFQLHLEHASHQIRTIRWSLTAAKSGHSMPGCDPPPPAVHGYGITHRGSGTPIFPLPRDSHL